MILQHIDYNCLPLLETVDTQKSDHLNFLTLLYKTYVRFLEL